MGKFILGFNDLGLTATYSSGNTFKSELGLDQLNVEYSSAVLHTSDLADLTINLKLKQVNSIGVLAISNHNLSPAATIQWMIYNDAGRTTKVFDSNEITVGKMDDSLPVKTTVQSVDNISGGYLTIVIKDSANSDGFIQIGNLFCGQRFDTDCNMDYGFNGLPADNSTVFVSDGGVNSYIRKSMKRQFNMGFSLRKLEEGSRAFKLMLRQGLTKRVVFQFDEDEDQEGIYTIMGTLKTLSALTWPMYNVNNYNFSIEEEI